MKLVATFFAAVGALVALAAPAHAERHLYVSGFSSSSVAPFRLAPTGGLTPITGAYPTAMNGSPTVMTPDGRYLYVAGAGGDGQIAAHQVAATGTLAQVAGSPFTSSGAQGLVASADGRFLYVANIGTADTVSAFAIASGGGLAPLGTAPSGDNPSILVATPDGRHLYSINTSAGPGG